MAASEFFGNGWDDPRSGQILGLAQGLLSAPGGRGLALGLQGMRDAQDADAKRKYMLAQMGLVDMQAKTGQAQLKEMERKNADADAAREVARQFYGANGLPGASLAQPGVAPAGPFGGDGAGPVRAPAIGLPPNHAPGSPGQPTPAIALNGVAPKSDAWMRYQALGDRLAKQGLVDAANAQYALAEKFRPKYNTTPQVVRGPDGKLVNLLVGEDGSTTVMPYGVKPDIKMQDLGGKVVAVDTNDTQGGQSFDKSMTPGEVASNKLGWANNSATLRGQNMTDARAREATALGGQQYDVERGLIVNTRSGDARPVMQGGAPLGAKEKPLTDTQAKALQFSSRMENSHDVMNQLADKGAVHLIPGSTAGFGIGRAMRAVGGAENQQLEQAQRDFVNAILRRESGAAISPGEFESAQLQYFPQPLDDAKTIEQKKRNREIAIAGLKAEVPKGAPKIDDFMPNGKQSAISAGGWSAKKVQ